MSSEKRLDLKGEGASVAPDPLTQDASVESTFDELLRQVAHASEPASLSNRARLVPGRLLSSGRLQLLRRIGGGGMGDVYEAFDRERSCKVALKTFSQPGATSLYLLKNEFRTLADITHPCLIRLHELFCDDELWFFTMDLIAGEHFDRWVRPERALAEARLRHALPQLAAAVHAIHEGGRLHRDLKPSNVLLTADGQLRVLDFGLAVPLDRSGAGRTAAEHGVSGTPAYMAPEQAAGARVAAASDWYALGVMLFEALTGQLPFTGAVHELLDAKRQRDAPAPRDLSPGVPTDLDALCRALLAREPEARPDGEAIARMLGRTRAAELQPLRKRPSLLPEPVLLGRDAELETLRAAYRGTLVGKPAVVFVSGDSGIGKSALLERFLSDLRDDGIAVVLEGRCYERESVPYKAFDSLIDDLSRYLLELDADDVARLAPPDVFALTRLFPVLRRIPAFASAPSTTIADPQELRRRAFVGFAELVTRIGDRRPLLACIDDLQWIDADSTAFLRHLLSDLQPIPALLVLSYRSGADRDGGPLVDALEAARRNGRIDDRGLRVGPLPADAARQLAQRLLDVEPAQLADRVTQEAHGSPFLLRELCRQARLGPGRELTLQNALLEHIGQLTRPARELLEVVAVAGTPLLDVIAAGAAQAGHEAIDELRAEQLLRRAHGPSSRTLECYHDKIREHVVSSLPRDGLRRVHARLVDVLLGGGHDDPERLAEHCEGAGDLTRAARYAIAAADAARGKLAFARAAELYRRALDHLRGAQVDTLELELTLADTLSDGGRGKDAAPYFEAAARRVPEERALELRRRAAEQWLVSGRIEEGLAGFASVLAAVGLRLHRTPRTALLDLLRTRLLLRVRGLGFERRPEAAVPARELVQIDICKTAWSLSFVSPIRAAAFQARHLLYALRAGEPHRIAIGLGMEAVYASLAGVRSERRANALLELAAGLTAELDSPHAEAFVHLARGQCSYLIARWAAACESLSQAEAILTQRCSNVTWELNSTRFFWGNALEFCGELKLLGQRLDAWLKDAAERGDLYASATLQLIRARLTMASGDPAASRSEVQLALSRWNTEEFGVQHFLAGITDVQIDLYEGSAAGAWSRMSALWPVFRKALMSQIQNCRVPAHQHAGYAAIAMSGREPGDPRWLERAAAHARALRREKMPMASAFAQQIEAAIAHARGRRAECVQRLIEAAGALDDVRLTLYAAATRYRLGRLLGGARGDALSASAADILAAQGVADPAAFARTRAPGTWPG